MLEVKFKSKTSQTFKLKEDLSFCNLDSNSTEQDPFILTHRERILTLQIHADSDFWFVSSSRQELGFWGLESQGIAATLGHIFQDF